MSAEQRDLYISIREVEAGNQVYNGTNAYDPAPTFPTWWLSIHTNEGYSRITDQELTPEQVRAIAQAIDHVVFGPTSTRLVTAVKSANNAMLELVKSQLAGVRAQASRLANLEERERKLVAILKDRM